MADPVVNQIVLVNVGGSGGDTEYPCVHLNPDVRVHHEERESFVEIGEGHEPIYARVWMTGTQFNALPSDFKLGTGRLGIIMRGNGNAYPATLNSVSRAARTLQFAKQFYFMGARLCRVGINTDLYEVRLTTVQHHWKFFPVSAGSGGHLAYNVLSDDKTAYSFGGNSTTSPKDLQTIVTDLKNDLGIGPALSLPFSPAFTLNNLFFDKASAGEGLARILKPIGCHLVCDPFTDTAILTYSIVQLDYTDPTDENADLAALASVAIYEGTSIGSGGAQSPNIEPASIAPKKVRVRFPIFPVPSSNSPRWTIKTVDNPEPDNCIEGTYDVINAGDRYDVGNGSGGGDPEYTQDLVAIAAARAEYYFARANIPYHCQIFSGGYPLLPGSTIRRVRITMDLDGWFTTVWRHGLWDHPREDGAWDSYVHKWATTHRAPQFPELGEQNAQGFYQCDDGTFQPFGGTGADSKGQYQFQLHQMVAQSVDGWTYWQAHRILE